jgi:hypothetical protein
MPATNTVLRSQRSNMKKARIPNWRFFCILSQKSSRARNNPRILCHFTIEGAFRKVPLLIGVTNFCRFFMTEAQQTILLKLKYLA